MILVDYSAVSISAIAMAVKQQKEELSDNLCRHMILNSLRSYNSQWKRTYGNMVICVDGDRNWRKSMFKYYKKNRKKSRDDSDLDWDMIFKNLDKTKKDLKEFFPYKIVEVSEAEADDIIGCLSRKATKNKEKTLIVSSDKDFFQLHSEYVSQYRPADKKIHNTQDPDNFLKEHIIRGDSGDGVPNIFSDDDVFVMDNKRQKKVTKKRLEEMMNISSPSEIESPTIKRNYFRNLHMIDLNKTPTEIIEKIEKSYEESKPKGNQQLIMQYLASNRMRILLSHVNDFI